MADIKVRAAAFPACLRVQTAFQPGKRQTAVQFLRSQRFFRGGRILGKKVIVGAALAYALGLGFVPIRKQGKLPWRTISETYQLEYGSATLELHTDAVRPGERVLLVDDLIATGGTMMAGKRLLERLGAEVIEAAVIVDLPELGGADRLRAAGLRLHSLMSFAGH